MLGLIFLYSEQMRYSRLEDTNYTIAAKSSTKIKISRKKSLVVCFLNANWS